MQKYILRIGHWTQRIRKPSSHSFTRSISRQKLMAMSLVTMKLMVICEISRARQCGLVEHCADPDGELVATNNKAQELSGGIACSLFEQVVDINLGPPGYVYMHHKRAWDCKVPLHVYDGASKNSILNYSTLREPPEHQIQKTDQGRRNTC